MILDMMRETTGNMSLSEGMCRAILSPLRVCGRGTLLRCIYRGLVQGALRVLMEHWRWSIRRRVEEGQGECGELERPRGGSWKLQDTVPERSSHSGSSRSIQPSPMSATPRPPSRVVDEDYDGGVADTLMGLANGLYRGPSGESNGEPPRHSPMVSSHSRHSIPSPRPLPSHRNSVSSSHPSPLTQMLLLKRALSPGPEEMDNKCLRMEGMKWHRILSPSGCRRGSVPSTRPSPIPFHAQVTTSHSSKARDQFPPSPSLPVALLLYPRPISAGHSNSASASIALPLIET